MFQQLYQVISKALKELHEVLEGTRVCYGLIYSDAFYKISHTVSESLIAYQKYVDHASGYAKGLRRFRWPESPLDKTRRLSEESENPFISSPRLS